MKCVDSSEVMRLFAGKLSAERAGLLNAHFERCVECRALRDEVGSMTARLQHDPGEFEDGAAVDEVMTLIRMGHVEKAEARPNRPSLWKSWQTWLLIPATAAATAVLMVVLWSPQRPKVTHEFQARGGGAINLDRWVSIQVFRATKHGYEQVRDVVAPDDALAFAYLNRSGDELRYLAILGVDDRAEIFWYYPPNTGIGDNPSGISITSGAQPIELPEQVVHPLAAGPLRLFGIFSSVPLTVSTIEYQLQKDLHAMQTVTQLTRLGLEGVGQYSTLLQVQETKEKEATR